jgi:hypothetical protein
MRLTNLSGPFDDTAKERITGKVAALAARLNKQAG